MEHQDPFEYLVGKMIELILHFCVGIVVWNKHSPFGIAGVESAGEIWKRRPGHPKGSAKMCIVWYVTH